MKTCHVYLIILLAIFVRSVRADDLQTHGHIKYQGALLDGNVSHDTAGVHTFDFRGVGKYTDSLISVELHPILLGVISDTNFNALFPGKRELLTRDRTDALRLTSTISETDNFESVLRFDRAAIHYGGAEASATVGRQAISLGNGLLFHPLDVFSPFSPTAIDKEYKRGVDSVRVALSHQSLSETEYLFIPRRSAVDYDFDSDTCSHVLMHRIRIDDLATDMQFIGARHYDEMLYGIGASRDLFGATARADFALADTDEGSVISAVANIDRAVEIAGHNGYLFIEYFHSGFGASQDGMYLPKSYRDPRMERGELFTLAKNYIGSGMRVEIAPLVQFHLSSIINTQDTSMVLQSRISYDIAQNTVIQFGGSIPTGGLFDEFGSVPKELGYFRYSELYFRLEHYF